jgi:hypothetical protein
MYAFAKCVRPSPLDTQTAFFAEAPRPKTINLPGNTLNDWWLQDGTTVCTKALCYFNTSDEFVTSEACT